MRDPQRKVLLSDVAKRAGVSLGTASAALSGRASVSEEALRSVTIAAAELGYRPLRKQSRRRWPDIDMLGLLIRSSKVPFPANEFYPHVLHGAQRACSEHGISLTYEVIDDRARDSSELPLMVRRNHVSGLLVVGYFEPPYIERIKSSGLPFVTIDHRLNPVCADSVCNNDENGGYAATRHLIDKGHVSPPPAMIAGPTSRVSILGRLLGYKRALKEANLPYNSDYVLIGDLNLDGGYSRMLELLHMDHPPTAVFCCNDLTALGALNALHECGVRVPEECSLVGYDDISTSVHSVPPLTTISVDKELLGAQGVWHLLDRFRSPDMAFRDTRLSVRLVERRSVGSPRYLADTGRAGANEMERRGVVG